MADEKMQTDDALVIVQLRNEFYKKKYYLMLGVYVLSLLAIVILLGMLIYLYRHPPRPLYFATDEVGRLIQDIPLQTPNMPTPAVAAWTIEAIEAAFSYDFINYRAQLQGAQKYFTEYGWRNYMDGLTASGNLKALSQRLQIVVAKVVAPPIVLNEGLLGKAYAWKFQVPVLLTYLNPPTYDDKTKYSNAVDMTVVVQRQNILESYKGIGIVQVIGNFAANTAPQNPMLPSNAATQ